MDLYIQRVCFDKKLWQQYAAEKETESSLFLDKSLIYPFAIPAIKKFIEEEFLLLQSPVTIFIGENGSGKSTFIEAIAKCFGLNPEGGSKNFNFATYQSHSCLDDFMYYSRIRKPRDSYFLRAESFYNVITEIERMDGESSFDPPIKMGYGGANLHTKSHGEAFFAVLSERLRGNGLYIMDEPEAAISITRQLEMLQIIKHLEMKDSQFIIATHSPIIMAYPGADIIRLDEYGFSRIDYEYTDQYQIMRRFMADYKKILKECGL